MPAAVGGDAARSRRRSRQREAHTPTRATGRERRAEARARAEEARAAAPERRGLPTIVIVLAVAAVVALVLGLVLATGFLTPPGSSSPGPAATLRTVLRAEAADVVVTGGSGWAVDDDAGTIRRFDPSSGAWTGHAIAVGQRPVSVAAGFGRLWVADAVDNTVVAVNPATGKLDGAPVEVAAEPVSVAAGDGGVWVASLGGNAVTLIDPHTKSVRASVALEDGAVRLALGAGAVWVTGQTDTLTRISPKPLGVSLTATPMRVGNGPIGVAAVDGAVWVADAFGGQLTEVDPAHLRVVRTVTFGAGGRVGAISSGRVASGDTHTSDPVVVAVADGQVWVGDGQAGTLTEIDSATGKQRNAPVPLPGAPRRLVTADDGSLWVTTANPSRVLLVSPS
jgi:streptogramin lyase